MNAHPTRVRPGSLLHGLLPQLGRQLRDLPAQRRRGLVQEALALAEQIGMPSWVSIDAKKMEGVFKSAPERTDLSSDINEQLVVEFYSK